MLVALYCCFVDWRFVRWICCFCGVAILLLVVCLDCCLLSEVCCLFGLVGCVDLLAWFGVVVVDCFGVAFAGVFFCWVTLGDFTWWFICVLGGR